MSFLFGVEEWLTRNIISALIITLGTVCFKLAGASYSWWTAVYPMTFTIFVIGVINCIAFFID